MLELVQAGGWLMLPILLCSVIAAAIIVERLWTLQTRKVNLLSLDRIVSGEFDIQLPIDSQLEEFTVQVSGERPRVAIHDASGLAVNKLTYGRRFEKLLDLPGAYTAYVKRPLPGMWRMRINANSAYTIRITGQHR